MTVDPYAESGEFIDVFSRDAWQTLGPPIVSALRGAVPAHGPILDIGAGTGLGTFLVAETLPTAEVVAVEPSPVLRAVLLSRLAAGESLRPRVTVVATGIENWQPPPRLGGVLAINMIGHLDSQRRRLLWAELRTRLATGAPLIVNLQPPAEVTVVPPSVFSTITIGRHTYEGSGDARPAGDDDDTVTWTMRYRTRTADGTTVRDLVVVYPWHVVSGTQLLDELADAGFDAAVGELDVVVATPRD
ncbi:class I SAM-dependent methyltransferase [Micromonospora sp. 15K316]|uniref:class I SAM-dependent methyltransferase n=1 Tax=Micromonospora sp. 15K316 TaxID=2530376 RepID=UPI00104A5223|nr:class I SAM-dependent methyltransferase [Micromonospora sp. 15K316]TDC30060.1 class I SAM-dependent methyltransferase [Micromonospora sp. 15K316]